MANDVTFRRVRGRIIPIRMNKASKEKLKGAGYLAAAGAVGFAAGKAQKVADRFYNVQSKTAGRYASAFMRSNLRDRLVSAKQLTFNDYLRNGQAGRTAKLKAGLTEQLKSMQSLLKISSTVRTGAILGAGALAGVGYAKLRKSKDVTESRAASEGAAFGAAAAGFTFGVGYKGKSYLKASVKNAIPKLKSYLLKGL